MIRVTIELIPFGNEQEAKKIAEMVIANDGTSQNGLNNYAAWVSGDTWTGEPPAFGKVLKHDRTLSVWTLVKKAIDSIQKKKYNPSDKPESLAQRLKKRLLF